MSTQIRELHAPSKQHYSPSASIVFSGEKLVPLVIVLALLCGASLGLTAFAFSAARNADRESRLLEYYVMELDGKLMRAGLLDPKDSYSAKKRKE